MRALLRWLRALWPSRPAPRARRAYPRTVCGLCGRTFAHSRNGKLWRHHCVPPEVSS